MYTEKGFFFWKKPKNEATHPQDLLAHSKQQRMKARDVFLCVWEGYDGEASSKLGSFFAFNPGHDDGSVSPWAGIPAYTFSSGSIPPFIFHFIFFISSPIYYLFLLVSKIPLSSILYHIFYPSFAASPGGVFYSPRHSPLLARAGAANTKGPFHDVSH